VAGRLFPGSLPCGRDAWKSLICVVDIPTTEDIDCKNMPDPSVHPCHPDGSQACIIILEHVHARGDKAAAEGNSGKRFQRAASEWRFTQGFGATLAACQLSSDDRRVHLVTPVAWKGKLNRFIRKGWCHRHGLGDREDDDLGERSVTVTQPRKPDRPQ
jgi:hypothetical protein